MRGKERQGEEIRRERGRIVQESQPLSLLFFLSGSHIPLLGLFLFLGWFTLGQNPFGLFQVRRKPQKLCYPSGMHALARGKRQRPKNLGGRVALPSGKFLRVRKVFARKFLDSLEFFRIGWIFSG